MGSQSRFEAAKARRIKITTQDFCGNKKPMTPIKTETVATVMQAAIEPMVFNLKEAVAYSKIGRSVLYKLIDQEQIIAQKLGRRTLISKENIDSYLKSLPAKTAVKRPQKREA